MAELAVLVGGVIAAVVVALLDRAMDPRVRVVGSSGHRDRVRRAIDRMRLRKPAAGRPAGGTENGLGGSRQGPSGDV